MEQVISPAKSIHKKPDSRTTVAATFDKTEWKPITFGEVCRNINITEKEPLANGIERYVGLEHIETNSLHIKSWGNVSDGTTFTKKFTTGQVLFGKRRAYLRKAAIANFDGICSGDILVFEANKDLILPDFFPFLVQSDRFFDFAIQTSAGSLSPRTKFQDLAKFEFLLPPKEQQMKLAELLWAGNDVIEKYVLLKNLLENEKSVVITNALKDFESKESEKKLGNIASFIGGFAFKSNDFSFDKTGKRQVLKIANLTPYGLDLAKVPAYVDDNGYDKKYLFQRGDIIISLTGSNGKRDYGFAIINETNESYWVNQRNAIIRTKRDYVKPKFLYYLMKEDVFLNQFFKNAIGTANQANVSMKNVQNISLPLPCIEIQEEFIDKIDSIKFAKEKAESVILSSKMIQMLLINQIFS